MKVAVIVLLVTVFGQPMPPLREVRDTYFRSPENKNDAAKLATILAPVPSNGAPVLVCYKGAAEMFRAKYAANPVAKMSAFGRGKVLIESALARDPQNIECRFIRFSVQRNLPVILGYRQSLYSDSVAIRAALDTLRDTSFKSRIAGYFTVRSSPR